MFLLTYLLTYLAILLAISNSHCPFTVKVSQKYRCNHFPVILPKNKYDYKHQQQTQLSKNNTRSRGEVTMLSIICYSYIRHVFLLPLTPI